MKKMLVLFSVLLCVTMLFTACGGDAPTTTAPANNGGDATTAPVAPTDKTTIRVGHTLQEDTASHMGLADGMQKYVHDNAGDSLNIEIYANSALGGERQMVEAAQLGTLEVAYVTTAVLANFENKVQVFDIPFLFNDSDIARKALDSELGVKVTENLPTIRLRNLTFGENGFRHVSNNTKPIYSPEDLAGIKIRTMENPIHIKAFQALGANPTPVSFNELYTALQQGTVDAQENPIFLTYTSKFYEVQKYFSLTGHFYAPGIVVINNATWEKLPEDLQVVLQAGADEFRNLQRDILDQQNRDFLVELEELMEVNELTADQKAAFIDKTSEVAVEVAKIVGQDVVDLAMEANETFKS